MTQKYTTVFENDTINLSNGHDGYWLYDETRSMNLSMKAKTEQEAFVETILYYQQRLIEIETAYKKIKNQVDNFVSQFTENDQD